MHHCLGLRLLGCLAAVAMIAPVAWADDPPGAPDDKFFAESLQPLLKKYCHECHAGQEPKGELSFEAFPDAASLGRAPERWGTIVEYLEGGLMPPDGHPRPSPDEVAAATAWITGHLVTLSKNGPRDPGRVTIRRLNRTEYNNTVRDLIGIEFKPADDFPSDDVGYGFDNIGDVLSLPPLLLEKYLAAAEKIAREAILTHWPPPVVVQRFAGNQLTVKQEGKKRGEPGGRLNVAGEVYVDVTFPVAGEYILRWRAYGEQSGPDPVRMTLWLDKDELRTCDVNAVKDATDVCEIRRPIRAGRQRLAASFVNDYVDRENPDPARQDRNLIVESLEVEGPFVDASYRPESHRRIIFRQPSGGNEEACAREILTNFAGRAYRRPVAAEEVERLLEFVKLARADGASFDEGIQLAVEAALVSPHFLFRVELDADSSPDAPTQPIDNFQLAARLSYFLWSSLPDGELVRLAEQGVLSRPDQLSAQVQRMLVDPKAQALVENFAGQWLQLRNLSLAAPHRGRFKDFDDELRRAMLRETELFFATIMREDRSVLEFLDADYTFLNERLARHYGIEGVEGDEFRRVALADRRRGGVLTQASILTITSNPTRTSPVKRGKWIMEQILGTPPPPPPPGVQELEQVKLEGTLRQKMEQHRANPNCAVCHARMDPLGFALENFDAVGAWRDRDEEREIDASGTLPGGQKFAGAAELRAILQAQPDLFARSLARKMLTYALGRGLEAYDTPAVNEIAAQMKAHRYTFSSLVLAVVESQPFRLRRARGVE